jgi:signal peptide peptidase SppA
MPDTIPLLDLAARAHYAARPWAVMPATLGAISEALRPGARASFVQVERVEQPRAQRVALPPTRRGQRSANAVQIIPLRGVLTPRPSFFSLLFGGGGGLETFRQDLRQAVDDEDVTAIVLDVDSPGGLVDLIPETAAEIRGARDVKPIVAVADTRAASAAYWLAAQASELVVTPSGEVGSIGVYLAHESYAKANEDFGVEVTYVWAGRYKTEGNPDEPLSDDAEAHMQESVDEAYGLFVDDVAAGRGVEASVVRDGYGEGRVLPASMALEANMVDRVATLEDVVSELVQAGGTVQPAEGDRPPEPDQLDEEAAAAGRQLVAAARHQRAASPTPAAPARQGQPDPSHSRPMAQPSGTVPAWLTFATPRH